MQQFEHRTSNVQRRPSEIEKKFHGVKTSNVEGAPARHREPYSMLLVILLARSGEAGGSLCLYYKW